MRRTRPSAGFVGNVIGTSVSLTGQKLIKGITTAHTYTPRVNAPSQVISLSQVNLPGLNLSTPHTVGAALPTAVAGKASYIDGTLSGSSLGALGPQALLNNLPSNLQPSSTLFYYNPQAEDLMLQQAALQQTGKASFIDGLTYDSTNNESVTEQEKGILYQNAIDYAKQNNLQLGDALSQTQINALTQPMLWYVQQSVPDPSCVSTGPVACPTVTALMPQVYLPQNTSAMSAGGNITGQNVTLNFDQDGQGSVLNTGNIAASNTLTVNTGTLTNQANQVNVGDIWQFIAATGYAKTSGTEVQPGGFMSAANMNLNVQTLNQIGGALQTLNSDGTADQTGTQQLLASLQQQLGANFTQTAVSDHLDTSFTALGGFGASEIVGLAFAVVVSIITAGAASAAIGFGATAGSTFATSTAATAATATTSATVATTAGLGNIALSAAMAGFTSSIASQLTMTGSLNWGSAFEAAAVAGITAGLTNGITYNSDSGIGFTTGSLTVGGPTSSLASLAGVNPLAGTSVSQASASTATTLETRALAMLGEAGISAGVGTAIEGGSLGTAFKDALTQEAAAAGAFAIGGAQPTLASDLRPVGGELAYLALHGALGCAAGAASGQGCSGGAIGGATSALIAPLVQSALYNGTQTVTYTDNGDGTITQTTSYNNTAFNAMTTSIAALSGGLAAGLAEANAQAGATWAENEAQNNTESTKSTTSSVVQSVLYGMMPWLPGNPLTQTVGSTITSTAQGVMSQIQANYGGQTPPSDPNPLVDANNGGNTPSGTAGAVVTPPVPTCVPGEGCVVTPPLVSPGSASTPPNATLSSGSEDSNGTGGGANGNSPPATKTGSTVPPSILGANGNLPSGIGGTGTPIPMPATADASATAEQFATAAFNGQTPVKVIDNITGEGSWVAIMPDGTAITYRPAGQASALTDPGTATVEINSPSVRSINNGDVAKFKFPSN
jgi:filamentous hemagglutinin